MPQDKTVFERFLELESLRETTPSRSAVLPEGERPGRDLFGLEGGEQTFVARKSRTGSPEFRGPSKLPVRGQFGFAPTQEERVGEQKEREKRQKRERPFTEFAGELGTELLPAISLLALARPDIKLGGALANALIRGAGMGTLSATGAQAQRSIRESAGGTERGGPIGPVRPLSEIVTEDIAMNVAGLGVGKLAQKVVGKGIEVKRFLKETKANPSFFGDKFNAELRGVMEAENLIPVPKQLPKGIAGPTPPIRTLGPIVKDLQAKGEAFFHNLRTRKNNAFEALEKQTELPQNTVEFRIKTGPPKPVGTDLLGLSTPSKGAPVPKHTIKSLKTPIRTTDLQTELRQLRDTLAENREGALLSESRFEFERAEKAVQALTTPLNTVDGPKFVASYKQVNDLRELLFEGKLGKFITAGEATEVQIASNLEQAIQTALKTAADPDLLPMRIRAFELEGEFKTKFPKKIREAVLGRTQIGGIEQPRLQELASTALNSEEGTKLFVDAMGGDKVLAKEFFLTDLLNKNTSSTGGINFNALTEQLGRSRSSRGGGVLFTSKEFQSMQNLLRNAQNLLPEGTVGNRLMSTQDGRIAAIGTFAGMRGALGGQLSSALASFGAGLGSRVVFALSTHSLAKKIMLDPKRAGQMAELIKTGSINNPKARSLLNELLHVKGLVGTLKVQTEKGGPFEVVAEDVTLGDNSSSPVPPIR